MTAYIVKPLSSRVGACRRAQAWAQLNPTVSPFKGAALVFGAGSFTVQRLSTDPIGSATLTFTVKDSTGAALMGYEYRLYVKSSTPGVIGASEIIGAETQATNPVVITYNVYQTPTVAELQILLPGYLEYVTEFTLGATPINQVITLALETNI